MSFVRPMSPDENGPASAPATWMCTLAAKATTNRCHRTARVADRHGDRDRHVRKSQDEESPSVPDAPAQSHQAAQGTTTMKSELRKDVSRHPHEVKPFAGLVGLQSLGQHERTAERTGLLSR